MEPECAKNNNRRAFNRMWPVSGADILGTWIGVSLGFNLCDIKLWLSFQKREKLVNLKWEKKLQIISKFFCLKSDNFRHCSKRNSGKKAKRCEKSSQ
jgi:hypothetical protein